MSVRTKILRGLPLLTSKRRLFVSFAALLCGLAVVAGSGGCKSPCCGANDKNNETEKALNSSVERGQEKTPTAPAELDEATGSGSGAASLEDTRSAFDPYKNDGSGAFVDVDAAADAIRTARERETADGRPTYYRNASATANEPVGANAEDGAKGEIDDSLERDSTSASANEEESTTEGPASGRRALPNKLGDYAASESERAGRFVSASFRSAATSGPVSSVATKPVGTGKPIDVAAEIARGTSRGTPIWKSVPAKSTASDATEPASNRRGTGKAIDVSAEIASRRAR